jgi:hypothetical protein
VLTVDVRNVWVDVVCTPKRVFGRFALAPRALHLLLRGCFPLKRAEAGELRQEAQQRMGTDGGGFWTQAESSLL